MGRKLYQIEAIVRANSASGDYGHCVLAAPEIARSARPGECVNIRISDGVDPLLRRPFGIHRVDGDMVAVMYAVVGRGTRLLSRAKPGERVDVVGPFGHGFDTGSAAAVRMDILVAGGIGAAPLVFLAEKLAGRGKNAKRGGLVALVGAKTGSHIICEKEFRRCGCQIGIATDDGSKGFRGRVTELLEARLRESGRGQRAMIYACGPQPMLERVSRISRDYGVPAQVSLESHMGCGIGACMGCIVRTRSGNKRACKDGPVFDAGDVVWE